MDNIILISFEEPGAQQRKTEMLESPAVFAQWLRGLPEDGNCWKAIKREYAHRNGKKQTPHAGPGRPKGSKNKPK